ncbi:MAG: HAD-IA family hydrolase [Syntrophales bacterium]|nr:HAD-IA family hydrolase [Syntrophales bacterium]
MKSVDLLIFDLDGTLVTSGADIAASVNHTLKKMALPTIEDRLILEFIGDGVKKLIERSLGPVLHDRFEEAMTLFSHHYHEHMLDTTTLYPGVLEVLRHFHDKKKVVLTNKRHHFAAALSDALQLTQFFDDVIGADSTPYIKPDARLADVILKRFQAHPDRTVVIGDGVNDILLAKNAGLLSCAFLNGLTGRETLLNLKPDDSCEHLSEITKIFC